MAVTDESIKELTQALNELKVTNTTIYKRIY